jgi:hypothetical protein
VAGQKCLATPFIIIHERRIAMDKARHLYRCKLADGNYMRVYAYEESVEKTCYVVAKNNYKQELWKPICIEKVEGRSTSATPKKPAKKAETKTKADKNSQLPGQISFEF